MLSFKAKIEIIGINPYVLLPEKIRSDLFEKSGKTKGYIPVKIAIGGVEFVQTLVKYAGEWRLYLNTPMRNSSNTVVGDMISIDIDYDSTERLTPMHPKLQKAMEQDFEAKRIFDGLTPSRQKEILRYINHLKSEESIERNIAKAIADLRGKENSSAEKINKNFVFLDTKL